MSERSLIRSFAKSDKMSFAKSDKMSERLLNLSFEKSGNEQ